MKLHQIICVLLAATATIVSGFTTIRVPARTGQSSWKSVTSKMARDSAEVTETRAIAISTVAVVTALAAPVVALAEEADDYVYGAVNAPGGLSIAVVGGILAILTALLPLALKGGEEAFEEMKSRDDFGKSGDALKKRK